MSAPTPPEPGTSRVGLVMPRLGGRRVRVFSSSSSEPRFRRASDVLLLVPAGLVLVGLAAAYPPSRFERSLARLLATAPAWLDPVWELVYSALTVWALVLVIGAILARRGTLVMAAVASAVIAVLLALGAARVASGGWPELESFLRDDGELATFPVLRVSLSGAVILALSPFLVRPLQLFGRWVLGLGLVAALLVSPVSASACLAALAIAALAAAVARLMLGTSAGQPEPGDIVATLAELGVAIGAVGAVSRQSAGVFVARGEGQDGVPLLVKVYGRDAYDNQLLAKLWRTLWYQGTAPRLRLSRAQAVEHEALVTLLARQSGVPTRDVVTAGETSLGDAVLVLRDPAGRLVELDDRLLGSCWAALVRLGRAGIAHLRIEPATLVVVDGEAGFVDFDRATLAPRPDQLLTDRSRLLATTAALVGSERAIAAALDSIGADELGALLPYLQTAAFDVPLRRALEAAGIDDDELRDAAAAAAGVDAPGLVRLRRVTPWTLVQLGLLALAVWTVLAAVGGLDLDELRATLDDASWWWVAVGLVVAQLPRVSQAISTLGSVPARLPFRPVYAMQLATGYMNLALPSNLARMAINIRFFQKQGIVPAAAVTAGAIDSFASTVIQAVMLAALLVFSEASLDLSFDLPSGATLWLGVVVIALAAGSVAIVLLVGRLRQAIVSRVRRWWPEVRAALGGLRASHKLGQLIGGSLATEVLFAIALGMFANAMGFDVGLADLLVINISVSLLASFVPVPGGIGVAEFGLVVGLVSAGMTEEAALAAVLLYRAATFYLPPVWGFFAMRWLQRNAFL